jgi:hypothetical protein
MFQTVLLYLHSWLRWLILLAAFALVIRLALGLAQKSAFGKSARILTSAFSGLMDLQVLLGVIQLVVGWQTYTALAGGFPLTQIEHMTVLLLAAVAAHLPSRWKNLPDALRYRNGLIVAAGVILMIVVGVSTLAGRRWMFRF